MDRLSRRAVLAGSAALTATTTLTASPVLAKSVSRADPAPGIAAAVSESLAKNGIPGAAVAVARSGVPFHAKAFGFANLETATPVALSTVFRYGSVTKQFAAAAAIKLAEQGKLDLNAPVSDFLPAFKPLKPFTVLELMHQTAGLHSDESAVTPTQATIAKSQIELAAEIANQAKPFDFDPGTAWLYSNANYIVLGAVIEAVSKASLAQAMKSLVFTPLGLTSMAMDTPDEVIKGRASGYSQTGNAAAPFANAPYVDPSQAGGAGAMRGTVIDLVRWHEGLLSGKLFGRTSVELMIAPGKLRDGRLSGANRHSPDDVHYGETQYASGLLVTGPGDASPSILHYGSFYGFCAMVQTFVRQDVTIAALCNTDLGPDVPFRGIRKAVLAKFGN